ncbi:putative N-acetyltransferase, GNAT family [Colletotrichum musicola]|uniref:Putative N-acetyltransferase, GNAT family n=1 Tax=Colletotrichum musicola TaxID=2175873 RepID=A0A8H6NL57_9PEZI|nr:putative N-acetyltransferase, GNAT family [Colletotrichum musicola]
MEAVAQQEKPATMGTETLDFVTVKTTLPTIPLPPYASRPPVVTERLILRPVSLDDLQPLHALRTQPETMKWSVAGRVDADLEQTRSSLVQNLPPHDADNFNFSICLRSTGQWIGIGGVKKPTGELGWPEIGYMLLKDFWGSGYATEFLRGFLSAWWSLPRSERDLSVDRGTLGGTAGLQDGDVVAEILTAVTAADNHPSQKLLGKCGFEMLKVWKEKDEVTEPETVGKPTAGYQRDSKVEVIKLSTAERVRPPSGAGIAVDLRTLSPSAILPGRRVGALLWAEGQIVRFKSLVATAAVFFTQPIGDNAERSINMSQLGLANNIATATGILGCAWWAGVGQSLSIFSVPAALESSGAEPIIALKLWQNLYLRGHATGPKVAVVTFLSLVYSAYDRHSQGVEWKPFVAAAALSLAIVPFTRILMGPTNARLMAGAQGVAALGWQETRDLLATWRTLNFLRSFFSISAAAVGLWFTAFE